MPFTAAHPALVLPLRRTALPLAALVAGSLAPDVPLYVPGGLLGTRDEAHSWTHTWLGLFAFCLPAGMLLLLAWALLLERPVHDCAPDPLRERLAARPVRDARYWLWSVPAVLLGALGHLGWDQLTHEPSWTTEHVPVLAQVVAGLPVARWLMYACSLLGVAALAWAAWRTLATRPPVREPREVPALATWLQAAPAFAATAAAFSILYTLGPYMGTHAIAYFMLTAAISAAGAVLAVLSLVWHLLAEGPAGAGLPSAGRPE